MEGAWGGVWLPIRSADWRSWAGSGGALGVAGASHNMMPPSGAGLNTRKSKQRVAATWGHSFRIRTPLGRQAGLAVLGPGHSAAGAVACLSRQPLGFRTIWAVEYSFKEVLVIFHGTASPNGAFAPNLPVSVCVQLALAVGPKRRLRRSNPPPTG